LELKILARLSTLHILSVWVFLRIPELGMLQPQPFRERRGWHRWWKKEWKLTLPHRTGEFRSEVDGQAWSLSEE